MADRQIEYVPLDDLQPNPDNPKRHDVDTIDASIGRLGYVEPVVIDGRTGYLVSGHGRRATLRAMKERGVPPPPGVDVDPETDVWRVPAVTGWESVDDDEATAAIIALNRTTEIGGWEDDSLLDLLDTLGEIDDGLEGVGFDDDAIRELEMLTGRLADDDTGFLDGLAPDDKVDSPFDKPTWKGAPVESDEVVLRVTMTADDRDSVNAVLESIRDRHGLETIGEALVVAVMEGPGA